jgi:hypothetical protein
MSRTKKGQKSPGYEYWSKRPNSMSNPGKVSKNITHRKERAESKKAVHKAKKEVETE